MVTLNLGGVSGRSKPGGGPLLVGGAEMEPTPELARYAMREGTTLGRRHPEPPHPYRGDYQRDRDRVVHTKAFRRLEAKTQVFAPDFSDHFRNRLTHTIEVSQIARTVSRALGLNTDLCEVLALSHDIGHPPFGHEGERALDEIMRKRGSGFDHNLHALRIVEDFEEKYADFRGLNLTFEVREGIVKHSRDYPEGFRGYVDISEYRLGERPPLEAQLIDLVDEIAYNSADLDDGYDSELLTLEQIVEEVPLCGILHREVERRHGRVAEKLRLSEVVRRLIDTLATSLVRQTAECLRANGIDSVEKVRGFPERLPGFDPETSAMNRDLKAFLHRSLYEHPVLREGRRAARNLVETLFESYAQGRLQLPESHRRRIPDLGMDRVVCDYVAGMTDTFAHARHAEAMA